MALGKSTSGLFGTPPEWVEQVRRVADRAGDRAWPMPLFEDYREQLKSEIADFTNTGGRPAGSITAALFISEFTGGLPWVHMDIAGTAWAEERKPYLPKGPAASRCARSPSSRFQTSSSKPSNVELDRLKPDATDSVALDLFAFVRLLAASRSGGAAADHRQAHRPPTAIRSGLADVVIGALGLSGASRCGRFCSACAGGRALLVRSRHPLPIRHN